jgi:SAM-dependent methyltransferase
MSSAEAISLTGLPTATVRRSAPQTGPNLLTDAFAALNIENYHEWAWANYKRVVRDLSQRFKARRLIEVGGGRDPLFDRNEVAELNAEMTVNDIAPGELAVLPQGYRTACFDVAGDLTDVAHLRGSFDLAFSRMVFEHVADGEQAWANLHELLAPGGVALAFVPTLYALPFVLNWLLPDKIAAAIVKLIYRHRTDDGDPVFPARYSWCFAGGDGLRNMLSALGYREVVVQPFYGHGYYRAFPIVRDIHEWFTGVAQRRDWRIFAGFAYIAARK